MGNRGSSERSPFEIANAERGYSDAGFGPVTDADAFKETPPPFARSTAPAERRGEGQGTPTPNIRKVARKQEEVDRVRGLELPSWALPALLGLVVLGVLGTGIFLVSRSLFRDHGTTPEAAQPAPEAAELDGIPVRKGLGR